MISHFIVCSYSDLILLIFVFILLEFVVIVDFGVGSMRNSDFMDCGFLMLIFFSDLWCLILFVTCAVQFCLLQPRMCFRVSIPMICLRLCRFISVSTLVALVWHIISYTNFITTIHLLTYSESMLVSTTLHYRYDLDEKKTQGNFTVFYYCSWLD